MQRLQANALEQFKQPKPTPEMFDSCRNCGALQGVHENASMELRRLDNVLVWQGRVRCPCTDPRDLTNAIGFGHRSRGYILKGSLGLPTMPMENYRETCLFCMYGLW